VLVRHIGIISNYGAVFQTQVFGTFIKKLSIKKWKMVKTCLSHTWRLKALKLLSENILDKVDRLWVDYLRL
jgi:hypothetical protein